MSRGPELTLDQAVDQIGLGRFQRKLIVVAGASWAADAMEVLLVGFAILSLTRPGPAGFGLSREQALYLSTALFVGMMIGAWGWGSISDRIGRKLGFVATILIDSVFGFLSAFAPNYLILLVLRGLTGFGVGGTLPVDYAITAEFLPTKQRGRWLVFLESFWALGTIVAAGLALLIIPNYPDIGWRILFAASAVPGIVVVWVRRSIPESPRYLLTQGREEEARAVLLKVAAENGTTLPDGFRLKIDSATAQAAHRQTRRPLAQIFQPSLIRSTLMLSAVWFFLSLAYYGIFTWLPGIFLARGADLRGSGANSFLLALAQIPGYFSAAWLIERWGRRKTLAAYLAASAVFTYIFAVVPDPTTALWGAILMSFFALGAWGCLYAYTPELYPTTVRVSGMGFASAMARVAGIIAPIMSAQLATLSLPLALTIYAAAFGLAGLASLTGRETMGATLEDTVGEGPTAALAPSPSSR